MNKNINSINYIIMIDIYSYIGNQSYVMLMTPLH